MGKSETILIDDDWDDVFDKIKSDFHKNMSLLGDDDYE